MNNLCKQKWSYLYKKSNYQTGLKNFVSKLNNIFDDYEKTSDNERKIISREYYEIWNKTMEIASAFLYNNAIPAKNDKDIVSFLICSGVFTNGEDVFLLYRGMCNLKKNNFILPKKYYGNKYLNILRRFDEFFRERTELEKQYAMDF